MNTSSPVAAAALRAFMIRVLNGRITEPVISQSTSTVTTMRMISASGSVVIAAFWSAKCGGVAADEHGHGRGRGADGLHGLLTGGRDRVTGGGERDLPRAGGDHGRRPLDVRRRGARRDGGRRP